MDIRSFPRSKRNPHFNGDNLEGHLPKADICYKWLKGLGGFRKSGLGAQSPHPALRSDGFRNYADYMLTQGFKENVSELLQLVHKGTACLMCAETLPFRCHRWYLSDYLLANGLKVMHIVDMEKRNWHKLSDYARIQGENVLYDRVAPEQMDLFPVARDQGTCQRSVNRGQGSEC